MVHCIVVYCNVMLCIGVVLVYYMVHCIVVYCNVMLCIGVVLVLYWVGG